LACAALLIMTIAAYSPVVPNGYVNYDDNVYVYENPNVLTGLTRANFHWAWTTYETSNYIPLTWISLQMHVSLFGSGPMGMHVENVLLHAINSMLLFLFVLKITREFWPCAVVAAIFAVHPVHVESVAWIAERKDVLSTLFLLLALHAYVWYAAIDARNRVAAYITMAMFFACGLLSKSMLVTFPFVLLLLDYWPMNRIRGTAVSPSSLGSFRKVRFSSAVLEKVPLMGLSALASVMTYKAQSSIVASLTNIPASLRFQNAVLSYRDYLAKFFWPVSLSVLYPYRWKIPEGQAELAAGGLCLLTVIFALLRRKRPYFNFGWLWFLGTLVPVIGIVQVGAQSMADRYLYVPSIGLSIAVVWPFRRLGRTINSARVAVAAPLAILIALTLLTRRQVGYWINTETLFHHASAVLSGSALTQVRLGVEARDRGDDAGAEQHFRSAIAIDPDNFAANFDLGNLLLKTRPDLAIKFYQVAAKSNPRQAELHANWGVALMKTNDPAGAFEQLKLAESLAPDSYEPHCNLAKLFQIAGDLPRARAEFSLALHVRPGDPVATEGLRSTEPKH
jgi:tetratricopeptide (TPR) repeat protein